ncbi:serine protease [Vibrio vulnificus]|nr:serine protease [Vibrio vulnificus]
MKLKLKSATILASLLISGCSNGVLNEYHGNQITIDSQVMGIPFLLGGTGSSVPITEELSITAKHIASYDFSSVVAHHPSCDISIIKSDNRGKPIHPLGMAFPNSKLKTFGRDLWNPLKTIYGEGEFLQDVFLVDNKWNSKDCILSIIDAPVQVGMSGGGVYNNKDELVGVVVAMGGWDFKLLGTDQQPDRVSLMVSTLFIRDWINEVKADFYSN